MGTLHNIREAVRSALTPKASRVGESGPLADLLALSNSNAGVRVTPQTAMQQATVYAAIRVLAEGVAQLPFTLLERDGNLRRPVPDHPLWTLLHDAPRQGQTAFEFFENALSHLNLRGNTVSLPVRSQARGGQIMEIIQWHPDQVRITQETDFSLTYTVNDGMTEAPYTQDQVWHVRGPSMNGYTGVSPIGLHREAVGLALATQQHGARLFRNGARPSGLLKMLPFADKAKRDAFREQFDASLSGENQHRTVVLEGADGTIDYKPLSMTSEDAQFLETRKFQRTEIAAIFRVPPHMLADLERATFSNIESQGQEFVSYSLMPWLRRLEQSIWSSLLTEAERARFSAKFNVRGLLRGDSATRSAFYKDMITHGVLSPNEVRALEDLNPRDGGDEYMTPANMNVGDPDA